MRQKKGKEEAVEEYKRGGVTLREMGEKYGINRSTLHRWVKGRESGEEERKQERAEAMSEMPTDVRKLQRELYEARLHTKLLETMIRIAEEDMGIPIRKKSGAKQR